MQTLLKKPVNDLTDLELSQLGLFLNDTYRTSEPVVSDDVFDLVYLPAIKSRIPSHPLVTGVQAEPSTGLAPTGAVHPIKMLSTKKAYTKAEVSKWIEKILKTATTLNIPHNEVVIEVSPKFDGIAGRLVQSTNSLYSRGNGIQGNDISSLLRNGLNIVGTATDHAIGEVVMKNVYFDNNYSKDVINDGFVDSRGFIAGMANSDTLKTRATQALSNGHVDFVIYSDVPKQLCPALTFVEDYEALELNALSSPYLLDGVIFDVQNIAIQKALGSNSSYPLYRLAKKQIKGAKPVTTESIRWQVGRSQKLTPVIEIAPTVLSRCTVTSITGHSLGNITKKGLGVGSVFLAHRSGEVIPAALETLEPVKPEFPSHCPCCDSPTKIVMGKDAEGDDNQELYCSNQSCAGSSASGLFHSFKRLNIDLFGKVACEKLVNANKTSMIDVLKMTSQDFVDAGFGHGQAANFMTQIAQGKETPLKDSHLIASLGIHLLGRGTAEKMLKVWNITELCDVSVEELTKLKSFEHKSSSVIVGGLLEKKAILDFLLGFGFNLTHTRDEETQIANDSKMSGLNIVFTGKMTLGSRSDLEQFAKQNSANPQKKVSKKTDILVIGEAVGATKINAAKELEVTVMTEAEYVAKYY